MNKKSWRSLLTGCVIATLLWPIGIFSALNQITDCRVQTTPTATRFVFDATAPIHYHLFGLENPDRLVIDIQNARLVPLFSRALFHGTPIKDIRTAVSKNNKLRMVLDLKHQVEAKAFTLNPSGKRQYRLVLDLKKRTPKLVAAVPASEKSQKVKSRPRYLSHYQPSYAKGPNLAAQSTKLAAKATPEKRPEPIKVASEEAERPSDIIIVIDPGHGGKDPGATGARGTHEKTIVLQISKALQRDINAQPGFRAYLTRKGDYYLTLRERLAIARRYKGDMFIAIHADAFRNHSAHGASVYALSSRGVTSEAARWLASKENESELMGGLDLTDKSTLLKSVLLNLSQTATIRASLNIGERIIRSLSRFVRLHYPRVEQAAFVVLKSPDIPSLLVETGFISNRAEENKLRDPAYQERMATALMEGIRSYFIHSPPRNTWLSDRKFNKKKTLKKRYVVLRGDTLSGISHKFNVPLRKLKAANHLKTSQVNVGQVLFIP